MNHRSLRTIIALLPALAATEARGQTPAPARTTKLTADLGIVSASGNTRLRTMSASDRIVHTRGNLALTQTAAYVYGETDSEASANQLRAALRGDYSFQRRLAVFAVGSYERNRFAGFTSRTDEMLGLAWKALATPSDSLSLDGGGVLTQQTNVDGTDDSFPSARLAGAYRHVFSKSASFLQHLEYLPNLETSGSYRLNSESALVAPISTNIGIKIAYVIRYDSAPAATFGTTDRVLTTGIQISY